MNAVPIGDLNWWQWVLLSVPVLLILFGVLWLAWLGRRPRFPAGKRIAKTRGRHEVHTILQNPSDHPKINVQILSKICALAVWSTAAAWTRKINQDAWEEIKEVCIYFVDDDYFESQPWKSIQTAAAFLVNTGAPVGAGLPMAVVRTSLVDEVARTGEPVIHEMLHALEGHYTEPDLDRTHTTPAVWKAAGGSNSAQHIARLVFIEHRMFQSSPTTDAV